MFIRKRTRYSKQKGYETESYQVVESYREGGKVKQRVIINLGKHPTCTAALEAAEHHLSCMKKIYDHHPNMDKGSLNERSKRVETLKYVVSKGTV